eukprot:277036_1
MERLHKSVEELVYMKQLCLLSIDSQCQSAVFKLLSHKMIMHQKLQSDLFAKQCITHYTQMTKKLEDNYKVSIHKILQQKYRLIADLNRNFRILMQRKQTQTLVTPNA